MRDAARTGLAAALKRSRIAAALTQEQLAERAGVSARTVSDIERGLRTTVYSDTARRLADVLELDEGERRRLESLLRGRDGSPTDLPAPPPFVPTRFFGRASELRALMSAFTASDAQLLTLTGPGGIGKTRLALEVANRLRVVLPDGVVFVPLGDLDSAALVVPALAKALGVIETGEGLELLIGRALASRRALILLDTFEHVVDAAPAISSLLVRRVQARFLVTSRRPLHIRGELEFPVPPLDMPERLGSEHESDLRQWPATALFVDRALAVDPHLTFGGDEAALALEICRKLNGLPLAIELCAARVKHLPLPSLAAQLDHRLAMLTGGPSDLPVRQRTMRATLGWSHDLLPPMTRTLFRRLAIFSGGFELASVQALCAGDADVPDALDGLSTLVDHSLIRVAGGARGPRYDMLDVIAEYAAERLAEAGETTMLARRHALHFLEVAEEAEPNLVRAAQEDSLHRLELERANLRRAIAWSIEHHETIVALRFTVALWRYWRHTGELAEGRRWCEATLGMRGLAPDSLRAKAVWGTAFLAFPQGDYRRMAELASEDLEIARRGGDAMDLRNALTIVGQVALCEGRFSDALGPLRESLEICRPLGLTWQLGTSCLNLGNALLHSGAVEEAERTYRDGLRVYRELGDETFAARMGVALAHAALARQDLAEAERLSRNSLAAFASRRERLGIAEALDVLAAVAAARTEIDRAASLDGAAHEIQETIASRPAPFERAITRTLIDRIRMSADAERWRTAWERGHALGLDEAVHEALGARGMTR
jgi:predicted ATPase/DNA-binding XRE family transcriptional regulator